MPLANFIRYVRLWLALARFALLNEMAFRGNFLLKVFVEVLWLTILLLFYDVIYSKTDTIQGWDRHQYQFFIGCYFAVEGMIETLFLENCQDFSHQVRTGKLDTVLLQPIDEQFLITMRRVDWSTVPNVLMGAGVMIYALRQSPAVEIGLGQIVLFLVAFGCAILLAYSFLLMLTSSAVWMVRNQSLMELWWLFSSLMRYPREVFQNSWAWPIGRVFTFVLPVMLTISVPAEIMVRPIYRWEYAWWLVIATAMMLAFSRWFFRRALRRYRSASS
ncbi:MAG: ABC-2 family transporter protein [Gemmataceae bacterium]|nr:ABC-2 family transporter protein [Gemmataceae bacterium]